ncbi:Hypothetical_protein [Hexamita inflata]|uniref:Hypothetical_protein n=1 Tax=Hexamita inflata TaxID=28002 RepID=A0AA86RF69_9EUKA|nr:Hypothetical protein HINF_LOCUS53650 [Hexamita inflata]
MIKNMCLQQSVTSTSLKFYQFGLIGQNAGNSSIQNTSVIFSVQGIYFYYFGIIGLQSSGSINAEVAHLRISVRVNSDLGSFFSSVIGGEDSKNCSILNTTVSGGNISTSTTNYIGGFIGYQYNKVTIINSYISNSKVSGLYYVGGIIGYCQSQLYLINTQIKLMHVTSTTFGIYSGVVVGKDQSGTYSFNFKLLKRRQIN